MEVWWMDFFKRKNLAPLPINYDFPSNWCVLYEKDIPNLERMLGTEKFKNKLTFCNIKIATIEKKNSKMTLKLFGFIPLFTAVLKNYKIKVKFLGIPIIKIK